MQQVPQTPPIREAARAVDRQSSQSAFPAEGMQLDPRSSGQPKVRLSRRSLLALASAGAAAVALPASAVALPAPLGGAQSQIGPLLPRERRRKAWNLRIAAAEFQANKPLPAQTPNGDDELYGDYRASYAKGLPHDPQSGEVLPSAYGLYKSALASGDPSLFAQIPLGGSRKLVSPQGGLAFDMAGADAHAFGLAPAPAFASKEAASEMVELYWMALLRDVPFENYNSNPLVTQACAELSSLGAAYKGPTQGGTVTPQLLFRAALGLDDVGPYVSQFLLQPFKAGPLPQEQRYQTANPGLSYGTNFPSWFDLVRGVQPSAPGHLDAQLRYIRNGRDLAEMVRTDYSYQAFLQAGLILLGYGSAAISPTNPYQGNPSQAGFVTFGPAFILDLIARAANLALRATWFQKWYVHRRLRPEEFGGRIHQQILGAKDYGIEPLLLNCQAVQLSLSQQAGGFLAQAFPEGSPLHPAYPAGHAAIAGACVTVLKALFNESFVLPTPVVSDANGLSLLPYTGVPLTVRGELDKLAVNIAFGRNIAGVHYRTDGTEGLRLGEEAALSLLEDYSATYNEAFGGFQLTRFDGTTVQI